MNPPDEQSKNEDMCLLPPTAGYQGLENHLYRVEIHDPTDKKSDKATTFKWSVDNAVVVSKISGISGVKLMVKSTGRDKLLGFNIGQWAEVIDDRHELRYIPGSLVKLTNADGNTLTFDPTSVKGDPVTDEYFPQEYNPKVRRWDTPSDSEGYISVKNDDLKNDHYIKLGKDGVEVRFVDDDQNGNYKTGDYWLIPARTANGNGKGDIEWPRTEGTPDAVDPDGIEHHFSLLGLLKYDTDKTIKVIADCRSFFPSITDLASLYYVSGDGQRANTGGGELPFPLIVRTSAGNKPMPGLKVRFSIKNGGSGTLSDASIPPTINLGQDDIVIVTDEEGLAKCRWKLGDSFPNQQVEAKLVDSVDNTTNLPTLFFNANLQANNSILTSNTATIKLTGIKPGKTTKHGTINHNISGSEHPAIMLALEDPIPPTTPNPFREELLKGELHFEAMDVDNSTFNIGIQYQAIGPRVHPNPRIQ